MDKENLRLVFLKVISESLENVKRQGFVDDNPASVIEEAIPDFYKKRKQPAYREFFALYTLVAYWADALNHDFDTLFGWQPPVGVNYARALLEFAVTKLQNNEAINDPRILRFAE